MLNWIDTFVPLVYLAIISGVAWWSSRRVESADDLFLAGRGLGFGLVGLSLFASNISSTTLIGLSGAAYTSGIAVANYELMAGVVLLFAAVFLIPVYLRTHCRTVPEYLQLRYSPRIRKYVSAWMIALSILVDTAGSLYAGALVLQVFLPDLPLWPAVFFLGVFAGVYTIFGGLRAVMLTDAIQAAILLIGSAIISVTVFAAFDFSWSAATARLPDGHLSLLKPMSDSDMPWTGLLFGVPILGLYYWSMNHYISQRFLAAASEDHARWGATLAASLKLLPLFLMVLPGAMAVSLFPDLPSGDQVFPTLVKELLPVGLRGIVLAAILAAIMSTIDSTINAASALVHYDFLERSSDNPPTDLSAPKQLFRARGLTLGFMMVAIVWAPVIANFPNLFFYLQQMFAVAVPPFVVVYILGLWWCSGTSSGAWVCLLAGHGLGIILLVVDQMGYWPLHFLETAGLTTIICALVYVIGSRLGIKTQHPNDTSTFWSIKMLPMSRRYPWFLDYRAQLLMILLALVIILFIFR